MKPSEKTVIKICSEAHYIWENIHGDMMAVLRQDGKEPSDTKILRAAIESIIPRLPSSHLDDLSYDQVKSLLKTNKSRWF